MDEALIQQIGSLRSVVETHRQEAEQRAVSHAVVDALIDAGVSRLYLPNRLADSKSIH